MSEPAPDIFEEDQLLAAAAKMDFVAMRHIHNQLIESYDPAVISTLSQSYARHSRMMRQNLACLQRQKQNREKAEREREAYEAGRRRYEPDPHDLAVEARTAEVQRAVDRVISATAAGDEKLHTDWCHRFDREVDDWNEKPDWLDDDLDTVVARACKALGLPEEAAQRWRELPDPTFFPEPEEETPEEIEAANATARELAERYRPAAPAGPRPPPTTSTATPADASPPREAPSISNHE